MILIVDEEFESLIPALQPEQLAQLRVNILEAGRILDPIKVWLQPDGTRDVIIDGHNRYYIYRTSPGTPLPEPSIELVALPDREAVKQWMRDNQRGRRNLSPDQQIILDVRDGAPPGFRATAFKRSQAQSLLSQAPALAAKVIAGKKTLGAVYSDWLRSLKAEPDPVRPRTVKATKPPKGRAHIVIGDTQVKPGVQTNHLTWIGRYIAEQFTNQDVAIVHLGDHWDMPSLSSYDFGKKEIEGKRYVDDIEAGNVAMGLLNAPIEAAMARGKWKPERHFLFGNHEERILRACNDHPALAGALSLDALALTGWTTHKFLEPAILDGIHYSHYFYNPNTGRPYCGENLYPRLKTIGHSFTMGHQQGLQYCLRPVGGARHQGLVLGSTYLHDEKYLGPQGNANWRGIVVCHQVENGQYDPMFVSLDFLCRKYEGRTLAQFMAVAA